LIHL
jgi:hypothetical protein